MQAAVDALQVGTGASSADGRRPGCVLDIFDAGERGGETRRDGGWMGREVLNGCESRR